MILAEPRKGDPGRGAVGQADMTRTIPKGLRPILVLMGLAASVAPAGAASLITTATQPQSFYSGSHFFAHYTNGYYWVALHDGTRPVLYSSADAVTWAPA